MSWGFVFEVKNGMNIMKVPASAVQSLRNAVLCILPNTLYDAVHVENLAFDSFSVSRGINKLLKNRHYSTLTQLITVTC